MLIVCFCSLSSLYQHACIKINLAMGGTFLNPRFIAYAFFPTNPTGTYTAVHAYVMHQFRYYQSIRMNKNHVECILCHVKIE